MSELTIFDLDNTLINGDSDRNWGQFLVEKNIVGNDYLLESEKFYNSYYEGDLDINGFLKFCLKPLQNNLMEDLLMIRKEFLKEKIMPIMLDKAKKIIAQEKKTNPVIIATATNSFVTKPIAELFGVNDLVATEFEVIDNKFTGEVLDIPCFREGKVIKVIEWAKTNGHDLSTATFYSDSFNDLPLLKKVGEPIVVDGDDKLVNIARKNGWACVSFR